MNPTAGATATLEIRNSNGDLRYSDTGTIAAAGAKFFSFDFDNAPTGTSGGSTAAWTGGTGLKTAGTYSYAIYINGTDLVSSGTFTLISK